MIRFSLKVALIFVVSTACYNMYSISLVKEGKPVAEIVVDLTENTPLPIGYAAEELQLWVEKMSGGKLPIVSSPGSKKTKIYLGTPESSKTIKEIAAKYSADLAKMKGNDGFAIRNDGDNIYIFATVPKGVLNGVYRFLGLNSDIIFVRPMDAEDGMGTIFGKTSDFDASKVDLVDIPAFQARYFWDRGHKWQARLLNQVSTYHWKPEIAETGVTHMDHSATIRQTSSLGKTNPEFFAIRDGKPQKGWYTQLCFSNKKLLDFYTKRMDKVLQSRPKKVKYFGGNHSDNWRVCECKECLKPIKLANGITVQPDDPAFRSTAFWLFYDRIMRKIGKKHPGKYFSSLAYVWSAEPPKFKMCDQVHVTFAPFVKNQKIPIYHPDNKLWGDRIETWMKNHKSITIFEYYLCTTTPFFYNPIADVAAKDLRYYKKSGSVIGMKNDTMLNDSDTGKTNGNAPAFPPSNAFDVSAMEYWVISRLYWNPDLDPEQLRDEFCRRAFRNAAQPMREYFSKIRDVWVKDKVACYWNDEPVMSARRYIVNNDLQKPCRALLVKAEKMATHPGSKALIQRHRAVFEKWLKLESKLGKKLELSVPYQKKVDPKNFDFNSGCWKNAAVIDDFRIRNNFQKRAKIPTKVKVIHDRENLYLAFDCQGEPEKRMKDIITRKPGKKDEWPKSPCVELFFDGDLRESGGYYQLAFNPIGGKYDAIGYDTKYNNDKWSVDAETTSDGWKAIVTLPLASFGRNITMANRIGMTIFRNTGNSTWRGANVHQPGGFNDLVLKMD